MARRKAGPARCLVAERDQPLIAIPADEDGRKLTYNVMDDEVVDAVLPKSSQPNSFRP